MVVESRNDSYWIQVLPSYCDIFWIPGLEVDVCVPFSTNSLWIDLSVPDTKFLITMEKHVQKTKEEKKKKEAFQTF